MEGKIIEQLEGIYNKNDAISAKVIAKNLGIKRKEVNSFLYRAQKTDLVKRYDGAPPLWSLVSEDEISDDGDDIMYVFVDLDNSPLLEQVEKYANKKVQVIAIASHTYNNYISDNDNIHFTQLKEENSLKHAVQMLLTIEITEKVLKKFNDMVVISKSNFMKTAINLIHMKHNIDVLLINPNETDTLEEDLRDCLE